MVGSMVGMGASQVVSDILSSALGEVASRQHATKAFHRQKMLMKNMMRWRVQDLVSAGLNPQLALGGAQVASAQQAQNTGAQGPDFMEVVRGAMAAKQQASDLQTAEHQRDAIDAAAGASEASKRRDNSAADAQEIENRFTMEWGPMLQKVAAERAASDARSAEAGAQMAERDNAFQRDNPNLYKTGKVLDVGERALGSARQAKDLLTPTFNVGRGVTFKK